MTNDSYQVFPDLDAFDSRSLAWFAVHTRTRYEKKAGSELSEKGIETFVPLLSVRHKWSDRYRLVDEPLFPGYLFVRMLAAQPARIAVLRTVGVTSFVGSRGMGTRIPDAEIEAIRSVLHHRVAFELHPYVNVGQRVRIRGGCLDGIEGILTAVHGSAGIVVSVELIQRSIALRLKGFQVEPVHSAATLRELGNTAAAGRTGRVAPRAARP